MYTPHEQGHDSGALPTDRSTATHKRTRDHLPLQAELQINFPTTNRQGAKANRKVEGRGPLEQADMQSSLWSWRAVHCSVGQARQKCRHLA